MSTLRWDTLIVRWFRRHPVLLALLALGSGAARHSAHGLAVMGAETTEILVAVCVWSGIYSNLWPP